MRAASNSSPPNDAAGVHVGPGARSAQAPPPQGHLAALPGTEFAVWRFVGLRSAGFPVASLQRLADEGLASEARRLASAPRLPSAELLAQFRERFAESERRLVGEVRAILARDDFRSAIVVQNRQLLGGLEYSLRQDGGSPPRGKRLRRAERTVTAYWQRYCAKNDTAGWFGPFGWGHWSGDVRHAAVRPGGDLVSKRTFYFEGWAIDALTQAIGEAPGIRPWLAPRRMPCVHLDGRLLHRPYAPPLTLTPGEAAIFAACDGRRLAREVSHEVLRRPGTGLMTRTEILRLLDSMAHRGIIIWDLDVPMGLRPEEELRRRLERIGEPALREAALRPLDELERVRRSAEESSRDAELLDAAVARLERTFTTITGREPTRRPGEFYAGRTLFYADCRRDVELELGPGLLAAVADPLSLLLTSARWLTWRLASWYREAFERAYVEVSARLGSAEVPLARREFLMLLDEAAAPLDPLADEHAARWARLLGLSRPGRRLSHRSADLRPLVEAQFAAPRPGWSLARYHSPDLLVASESVQALERGDFEVVLGELHPALNTLLIANLVDQHPCPSELLRAYEADLPWPCVVTVVPKHWPRATGRLRTTLDSDKDYHLSFGPNSGGHPPGRELPIAALVLRRHEGRLSAVTRDRTVEIDVVELFGHALSEMLAHRFTLHRRQPHVPRVTVDRMVVVRESWSFEAAGLAFARLRDRAAAFAAAVAWADQHGMPRYVFLRTPAEPKPVLVDFRSPLSVGLAASLIRLAADPAGGAVTLQEMLPDPQRSWLPDGAGDRYTSELRIAVLDLKSYPLDVV